jgi:hypothetical protein
LGFSKIESYKNTNAAIPGRTGGIAHPWAPEVCIFIRLNLGKWLRIAGKEVQSFQWSGILIFIFGILFMRLNTVVDQIQQPALQTSKRRRP